MRTFLPLLILPILFFTGCLVPSQQANVERASDESMMLAINACVTAEVSANTPGGAGIPGFHVSLVVNLFLDPLCASADIVRATFEVSATDNFNSDWNLCGDGTPGGREFADGDKWSLYHGGDLGGSFTVAEISDSTDSVFFTDNYASCDTDNDGDRDAVELRYVRFLLSQGTTGVFTITGDTELALWSDATFASAADDDQLQIDLVKLVVDSGNGNEEVGDFLPVPGLTFTY